MRIHLFEDTLVFRLAMGQMPSDAARDNCSRFALVGVSRVGPDQLTDRWIFVIWLPLR